MICHVTAMLSGLEKMCSFIDTARSKLQERDAQDLQ